MKPYFILIGMLVTQTRVALGDELNKYFAQQSLSSHTSLIIITGECVQMMEEETSNIQIEAASCPIGDKCDFSKNYDCIIFFSDEFNFVGDVE